PVVVTTSVTPKLSRMRCELSDPTTSPATRKASRTSRRRIFMTRYLPGRSRPSLAEAGTDRGTRSGAFLRFGRRGHHPADLLAQFLARLEVRHVLARQRHRLAGLGVAAHARRPVVQRKTAESTDLDALAGGKRASHHLQQRLDGKVHVLGLQVRLAACQDLDQFGLGHRLGGKRVHTPRRPGVSGPPRSQSHVLHHSGLPPSCARSSAPRLVVPAAASAAVLLYSAIASAVSASSLALIDSCRLRPLRSMPTNLASTVSPTFRCWLASSTRS